MRNTVRITPMKGFSCAVGRSGLQAAGGASIAVGIDEQRDGERVLVIALRHADGTVMMASLGDLQADRFEGLVAEARAERVATNRPIVIGAEVLVQ